MKTGNSTKLAAISALLALEACQSTGASFHTPFSANEASSTVTSTPSQIATLPTLPSWTSGAVSSGGSATQVTVNQLSAPLQVAPSGATVNIGTNFNSTSTLAASDTLTIALVDVNDNAVSTVQNNLNNGQAVIPTTSWVGPITIVTPMTIPGTVANGTYYVMVSLTNSSNAPLQLTAGQGVTQDNQYRYYVGAVTVNSSASAPSPLAPVTLDLSGYTLSFDDEFTSLSLSDSSTYNGSNWYTKNEQCCLMSTDGSSTAMVGLSSPENPYSLLAGGGLDIRLQEISNSWYSGVLTSVDSTGVGFSQQYGYFEIKVKLPSGYDTWPSFWMLNTSSKSSGTTGGEIDIMEYIANPGFSNYFSTTLHDWTNSTTPAMSHNIVTAPDDGHYHTYGMMWTAETMTFYFDHTVTFSAPTPAVMHQPYYMLVDLGLGGGWPTVGTPAVNDMQIAYVRAYK